MRCTTALSEACIAKPSANNCLRNPSNTCPPPPAAPAPAPACPQLLDRTDAFVRRQPKVSGSYEQILGRSLEGLVNRAEELKQKWKDQYVSVEELVMAMADDARFGADLLRQSGVTKEQLEAVIQEIRGGKT